MGNTNTPYWAKRAAILANPTAATVFKQADNALLPCYVRVQDVATSTFFRLMARGRVTTGTTSNFLAKIQFSSDISIGGASVAATAANNTDLFTLTNRSIATLTRSWYINATVVWDGTSLRMTGQGNGLNAETIETANAAITALTGIDLTTGKCGFVVAAIFGTGNAGNLAYLDEFALEAV